MRCCRVSPIAFSVALLAATAAPAEPRPSATPDEPSLIVVDTDMGLDDVAAILSLASSPTVEIAAVTVVGGASSASRGAAGASSLLALSGLPSVPVARGADPPGPPPPWRSIAESLGGLTLPAIGLPVEGDAPGLMRRILEAHAPGTVSILAMGPLSNLASLVRRDAEAARRARVVVLAGGPGERPWNLAADPDATADVLGAKLPLAFLPDADAEGVALPPAFVETLTRSPRLPARLLAAIWHAPGHASPFIVDAALAAALLGPQPEPRMQDASASLDTEGHLKFGPNGSAKVLGAMDGNSTGRLLASLWLGAPFDQPAAADPSAPVPARIVALHGHLGPYVVLGYRMGRFALDVLGATGHFDVTAEVSTRGAPPEACFVDGVQLGTGATPGKGNLVVRVDDAAPRGVFTGPGGKRVAVGLRPGLVEEIHESIVRHGVGPTGLRLFSEPVENLFRASPAPSEESAPSR